MRNDSPKPNWDPAADDKLADLPAAVDDMRERCPVAYSELMGWSVFRHADVSRVVCDHDTFSNKVSRHLSVPNGMDPPEHTAYRRLIEPYFSPARMAGFEPQCRRIAVELVDRAVSAGDVEIMAGLARPYAVRAQCAFLGWPSDLDAPLIRWAGDNQRATLAGDRQALSRLAEEFQDYIDRVLDVRRRAGAGPDADVTASLMHETVEGRPLNNAAIASILRNWTAGEVGTIAAAVGIVAHFLARHPGWQERLRHETELQSRAIDEILRIHGPLAANRRVTTRRVDLGERRIEAGQRISVSWVAANRDGRVFDEPEAFRLDRDPADNLLYGAGIHVCPGAPLARLELRLVIATLLERTTVIESMPDTAPVGAVYPASGFAELPLRLR